MRTRISGSGETTFDAKSAVRTTIVRGVRVSHESEKSMTKVCGASISAIKQAAPREGCNFHCRLFDLPFTRSENADDRNNVGARGIDASDC